MSIGPDVRYLGCFMDSNNPRALGTFLWTGRSTNTPTMCLEACAQGGYIYSGTQVNDKCIHIV